MRLVLLMIASILAAGCANSGIRTAADDIFSNVAGIFSHDARVANYLKAHPDLPEDIRNGIKSGKLVKGMDKDQVTLCMGKPNKMEVSQSGPVKEETWDYSERRKAGSSIFDADVPIATLTFIEGPGGMSLSNWKFYGTESPLKKAQVKAPPSVAWPELRLDKIVIKRDDVTAIINGQLVEEGSTINGATVVTINVKGVLVKYKGETRLLKR